MSTVSDAELARSLGDLLARVQRGESFVVERGGVAMAQVVPVAEADLPRFAQALAHWSGSGLADSGFAADLERVKRGRQVAAESISVCYGVGVTIPTPFFTTTVAPNAFERAAIVSRMRAASAPEASFGRPRSARDAW